MRFLLATIGIAALAGSAMATNPMGSGIVVLHETAASALTLVGNSHIQIPAQAVYVNSTSASAVQASGTVLLEAPVLYLRGESNLGSHFLGQVVKGAAPWENPMSNLVWPNVSSMTPQPAVTVRRTEQIGPGYYVGIAVQANGDLTMSPGVYIIGNDGFKVNGGRIVGDGITIINVSGDIDIGGNGVVNLQPPTDGPYVRVAIAQHPNNTRPGYMGGNGGFDVGGVIYAPGAKMTLAGTATTAGEGPHMGDLVVANLLEIKGTSQLRVGRNDFRAVQLPRAPLFD
jgi:hypothetical protein